MNPLVLALTLLPCLPLQVTPSGVTVHKRQMAPSLADCNGNGISDTYEIAHGLVADCDLDGVPDSCQLAKQWVYLQDDGIMNSGVGWTNPNLCWLTRHVVKEGYGVIDAIEVGWGAMPAGSPATLAIWSDPDGDGSPADAHLLTAFPTVSSLEFTGELVTVDIPDTAIGPAGTAFFVGVYGPFDPGTFPMGFDSSLPSLDSWLVASDTPIQPNNLTGGAVAAFGIIGDGDWMVRALSCPTGHCGEGSDDDFDGVLDACEAQDCNGNGVPDAQDIALGISQDCQGDGIPDECQVAVAGQYAWADASMEGAVGTPHDHYAWLNHHVVEAGSETVTGIEVAWGSMPPLTQVTVGLWSDPNGDGNPADSQLIQGVSALTAFEFTGQYVTVNIPDTLVGPAGTSFFVGALGTFDQAWFAAGIDTSTSAHQSWFISSDAPIDPDDLSTGATEFDLIGVLCGGCDGNWTLRAIACPTGHCGESGDVNVNLLPDECEPDCNGNGLPDDYDILQGLETDCDGSGVPDSCEGLTDCDGNGLPDLCQAIAPAGLAGEYYANEDLLGEPLARIDQDVVFDFDATPPFPGQFPTDHFSVRWTGSLTTLGAGTYTFGLLHDDGVRLWVNGTPVIDEWHSSAGGFDTGSISLDAFTQYYLRLEYYEGNGGALVELHWQPPGLPMQPMQPGDLRPIYDKDADGIPDTCQVTDCNGNGVADLEDIAFGTSVDCDGNGQPDECQPCDDCDGNRMLDGCELVAGPGLVGQYFESVNGELTKWLFSRIDPNVDWDWGNGSPTGVPSDNFGARWTGTLTMPPASGAYTFAVQADDGVRFWLDNVLLVDEWHPSSGNTYTEVVNLSGGSRHLLRLDYYEAGGDARVNLRWLVPGGVLEPVPQSALRPDTDINGDGFPDLCDNDCDLDGLPDVLEADLDGNCVPDDCEGGTGYWRFEEAGGSTLLDDTPNGLDGTLNALPFRVTDVPVGLVPLTGQPDVQSLFLDWQAVSAGGFVTVPDAGGLLGVSGGDFTLEGWVKLDQLGGTGSADARQWLFMRKPAAGSDAKIEYAFLVQAGDLGASGRELAFRYGDGAAAHDVISSLAIQDTGWHFVSLAYHDTWHELRFGLDGAFETVTFTRPALAGPGPLLIGAHENQSGVKNQFVRGTIDEIRFTRAFLQPKALLDHSP